MGSDTAGIVYYDRDARFAGRPKQTLKKLLSMALMPSSVLVINPYALRW